MRLHLFDDLTVHLHVDGVILSEGCDRWNVFVLLTVFDLLHRSYLLFVRNRVRMCAGDRVAPITPYPKFLFERQGGSLDAMVDEARKREN